MKIFCDRLKQTRGKASQKVFAASLGLNQQTYQRYESGVREPDLEQLHRIGVVSGVSIDWLLGLPTSAAPSTSIYESPGAIVASPGANVNGHGSVINSPGAVVQKCGIADCENCKYKRLADAFQAVVK